MISLIDDLAYGLEFYRRRMIPQRGHPKFPSAVIGTEVAGSCKKASGRYLRYCKVKVKDLDKDFGHDHFAL